MFNKNYTIFIFPYKIIQRAMFHYFVFIRNVTLTDATLQLAQVMTSICTQYIAARKIFQKCISLS